MTVIEANAEKYQFVYHSTLAPRNGYTVFGAVCRAARVRNLERGIGGVLLFDGECFFQWAHGPRQVVQALLNAIKADTRHQQVKVWLEGPAPQAPPDSSWHAGFIDAAVLDSFTSSCAAAGALRWDAMNRLFENADLQPALAAAALEPSRI